MNFRSLRFALALLALVLSGLASCRSVGPTSTHAIVQSSVDFRLEGANVPRENSRAIVMAAWRRLRAELPARIWGLLGQHRIRLDEEGWPDREELERYTQERARLLPFEDSVPPCYVYDNGGKASGGHSCGRCMPINMRFEIGGITISPYLNIHACFKKPRGPRPFGLPDPRIDR